MKIRVFIVLLCVLVSSSLWPLLQQTETTLDSGLSVITHPGDATGTQPGEPLITNRDIRVGTNWETSDAAAVCGGLRVSPVSQITFAEWELNNERADLFYNTATPLWSYTVGDLDFGYPIDVSENGVILAVGDDTVLKIFDYQSAVPTWEFTMEYTLRGIELSAQGDTVYVAYYDAIHNAAYAECYEVGNTTALWSATVEGGLSTFTGSDDCSTLILTQYGGGYERMWVLDASDGSIIFDAPSSNQNPPALSYDGSVIVNGDYSGFVYLYVWDEDLLTYQEQWRFHVGGGGSSAWIGGMAVSGDGCTVAVGTLVFVTGGYDGEVYLFDTASPTPLWVYEHAGDYVIDADLTYDGSMLAVASYGPLDHSTADFMLFRRESNIPAYEINTQGSLNCVDIAEDGSFCATGGKAVHARQMGSGGLLFNIDCNLGGGQVQGNVVLSGAADNAGVKVSVNGLDDYFGISDAAGNFVIDHVPAGSYTLDYTKVGYVPGSSSVTVVEGQPTTADEVTMVAWGEPPLNLAASCNAGPWVALSWDAPASGTIEGYNIYRKQYSVDPYPEDPLATVGADELSFVDETAFPEVEYYYVVTAKVMGQYQTPYSNEDMGWIYPGFVSQEIVAYNGTVPTIDGVMEPGEWDDAFVLDTSDFLGSYDNTPQPIGSVMGYYKVNAEGTELYVAYVNMNDTELEDHDEVALYIDDNNDGVYPDPDVNTEGNYWAAYYAAGNQLKFRPIYNTGGTGDIQYLDNPQLEVSVASGYVVYEFMIPIGTEPWMINPSADNQSSLAIFVLDDNAPDPNDFDGWWPMDNNDLFAPPAYGVITYGGAPQPPMAPTDLDYTALPPLGRYLDLTWQCEAMNDFAQFNVYATVDGVGPQLVAEVFGSSFVYDCGDVAGLDHEIYVTVVNQTGYESGASNVITYTHTGSDPVPPVTRTALLGNYPNPFNPVTAICYNLAEAAEVELNVFNVRGQKVCTVVQEQQQAGMHTAYWHGVDDNGAAVASGLYFYKMKSAGYSRVAKMMLLK
jgi:WD40 repeat protein